MKITFLRIDVFINKYPSTWKRKCVTKPEAFSVFAMDRILFLVTQVNSRIDNLLLSFRENTGKHQESKFILTSLTRSNQISYLRVRDCNHTANGKFTEMNSPKTGSN